MANSMMTALYNRLPGWLAESLISGQPSQRAIRRIVPHQDVVIRSGVGRGLRFNCDRSNPDYSLGNNEQFVQAVFSEQLGPGDVLFDIGANVGFFSIISARLVGPSGHVYAFEPLADNAAAINHNVALNGFDNVTVLNAAVSEQPGQAELLVAHYSGGSALASVETPPPDLKERIVVETVSIDNLLATGSLSSPKMVKIDVEGAELSVLKGMVETMHKYRPVILFEIDDIDTAEYKRKSQECADFLSANNYQVIPLEESYAGIDWHVGHFLGKAI